MDRAGRRWHFLRLVSLGLGWVIGLFLVAVCTLRLTGVDYDTWQVALVSVLPWELSLSVPLLALSLWRRRYLLAAVAAGSLLAGLIWEGPIWWPVAHAPRASSSGRFRLFDANVAQNNFDLNEIAAEIGRDRPDVVTLEELTPQGAQSLLGSGVMRRFRWVLVLPRQGPGGMGIWSDIPMSGLNSWVLAPYQVELEGWIHPPGTPAVRIDVVHVYAPVGAGQPAEWRRQLGQVATHLAGEARPLVVVGDFNATDDDPPLEKILTDHLADAAILAGRGWEMSWPRDQAWVIPYLRIDHVLLSPTWTVTGYRMGIGHGSDHHPVIVELAPRAV